MPYYTADDGDVDDFNDYDPTPYSGGYDMTVTYGRSIPPSDETCYPLSSRSGDPFEYQRPAFSANHEPSAYGDQALKTEYSSYARPASGGGSGFGRRPESGGRTEHGSGYGGRTEHGSGYGGRIEAEYKKGGGKDDDRGHKKHSGDYSEDEKIEKKDKKKDKKKDGYNSHDEDEKKKQKDYREDEKKKKKKDHHHDDYDDKKKKKDHHDYDDKKKKKEHHDSDDDKKKKKDHHDSDDDKKKKKDHYKHKKGHREDDD